MMQVSARRRTRALTFAGVLLAAAPASAGPPAPAHAPAPAPAPEQPTVIAWSTYLRDGPGETYTAISELEHDTPVKVVGCSNGWCRVSGNVGEGYVDRDALNLPRTLAPRPPATTGCVVVGQADNRGPIPTRFCSARPSAR